MYRRLSRSQEFRIWVKKRLAQVQDSSCGNGYPTPLPLIPSAGRFGLFHAARPSHSTLSAAFIRDPPMPAIVMVITSSRKTDTNRFGMRDRGGRLMSGLGHRYLVTQGDGGGADYRRA